MALHEARILLALPPGLGPRVRDLLWSGNGHLTLVLEQLAGRTLADLAPHLDAPGGHEVPSSTV